MSSLERFGWCLKRLFSKSEKKLSGIIYEHGVDNRSFTLILSESDKALFGGITTQFMKTVFKLKL